MINVAHPGGVRTNIAHRQRGLWGVLNRLAFLTQRSPRPANPIVCNALPKPALALELA